MPFVKVSPKLPPDYKAGVSHLDHNVGYTVSTMADVLLDDVTIRTRKVPQFVGQMVSGTYEDARQRTSLTAANGTKNVGQETLISNMGRLRVTVQDSVQRTIWVTHPVTGGSWVFTRTYRFYRWAPGRARIYVAGKSVPFTPYSNGPHVDITFSELDLATNDWPDLTEIRVRRVRRHRRRRLFRSNKTSYYYDTETIDIGATWLDDYRNRTYNLDSTVAWSAVSTYRLVYRYGPSEQIISQLPVGELSNDVFEIAHDGTNVTSVTIASEANINPLEGGQLPSAGADYVLERVLAEGEDLDIISRRTKAWEKDETFASEALESVDTTGGWIDYSLEKLSQGRSVIMHGGRLMLIDDDNALSFTVSAIRDYINFYQQDSEVDGYGFNIETERSERIQWAVSVRDAILLGTDRNEYVILGVESPSNVQSRRYTGIGSSRPYAIRFGDKILFISRDGKRIIAYQYSDESAAWYSSDISSIAGHLFTTGIQSIHYMEDPISMICVVPEGNDGIYLLTWEPTYGVQAWTHHMDGQNVLAAAVATISGVTGLFLAVERNNVVIIEALDFREEGIFGVEYHLDSAEFLFWGWNDQEEQEEGDEVNPFGTDPDGNLLDGETNYTVHFGTGRWARFQGQDTIIQINGHTERVLEGDARPHSSTTLTIGPYEGADIYFEVPQEIKDEGGVITVSIGMPFVSQLQTLPILMESRSGAGMMKNTKMQRARVRIESSSDFRAGHSFDDMNRISVAEADDVFLADQERNVYSGDVLVPLMSQWSYRPKICIESYYAEPLNLLAIMTDSQVYE